MGSTVEQPLTVGMTSKGIVALGVTVLLAGIGIGIYFGVTGADSGTTSSDTEDERKGSIWKNIKGASQAVVVWQDRESNSWGQVTEKSIAFLTSVNGETSKIDKWTHPKNVGDNPKDRQQQNKAITGADAQNRCSIMFNNEFYFLFLFKSQEKPVRKGRPAAAKR